MLFRSDPSPRQAAERHAASDRLARDPDGRGPQRRGREPGDDRDARPGEADEERLERAQHHPRQRADERAGPGEQGQQEPEAEQEAVAEACPRPPESSLKVLSLKVLSLEVCATTLI